MPRFSKYFPFALLLAAGCNQKEAAPVVAAASPAVQKASVAAPPPVAALAAADNEKGTARAEVMELKRSSGGMLMLRLAIVNTTKASMTMFDFGPIERGMGTVGGIHLIDAVNKKKYFVVRDAENQCLCSRDLQTLDAGARINVWARFPAPPEDVLKISVVVPQFLPMDEVAITK